jgi:EmrB/QacA subfamily drug resistance transporter
LTLPAQPKQTHRPLVLAALVVAMFMAAIEATIVATAMPSIVTKLGGLALYSWVFSAFLLMQAVTTPVYGKLSDLFGRKRVFMIGISIFLLGSVLCGLAWSMAALVAFRVVQGLGAGAVQPLAVTLIGDLYTIEERGRIQGYVASVWGTSAILGPLAGALIVQHAHWAWIFWLNVPFGLVALALSGRYLHEKAARKKPAVDYAGAALLLVFLSTLMLVLTQGSRWGLAGIAPLVAAGAIAFLLFVRQERSAPDPIMHLELWKKRMVALANLATLAGGVAMMGVIGFLPVSIQGVLGGSALAAGFALCAMSLGWPIASVVAGRLLLRVGMRRLARFGGATVFLGSLVVALAADRDAFAAGAGSFVMGVGFGVLNTTFIVSIQASVDWSQRGVATASNILMRILGNALGAAVFGGVLNLALRHALGESGAAALLGSAQDLLGGEASGAFRLGLASGLHWVFAVVALVSAVTLAASWMMPDHRARAGLPVR